VANYGAIIINGEYPLGSAALRKRMIHDGLKNFGFETELLHYFPKPSHQEIADSEHFVHFFLQPTAIIRSTESKINRNLFSIVSRVVGILRIIKYLRNRKVNFLLISGGFFEGVFLKSYCRSNNVKFFIERADENRRRFLPKKGIKDRLAIYYEDLFDWHVIKHCDHLFVVSEYLEKKYSDMHDKLSISRATPSFVNLRSYKTSSELALSEIISTDEEMFIRNNKVNVLFCGSYIFKNGIDFFLECASTLINRDNLDFQIILIVFKAHRNLLDKKILDLNLLKNTIIIENIMSWKIPAIYKHADILVLPEMGIEVAHAGFPGKTAEYLAAGKAIIATEFSNITDYLHHEHNVMMSPIGDVDSYTSNFKRLLVDPTLRNRLGVNAKDTAQKHFSLNDGIKYFLNEINS
jgi:glycosyltransferase involved in cell wall biosynthesis